MEKSMSKAGLIIDSYPIRLSVEESEGGKYIARGEFGRCDVPTRNGRVYPRGVYEREIKKLQEGIQSRRAFGELDHPADGKTMLQRVSHIITSLELTDDGKVIGEAEILDTPNGKTLKAILAAGAEAGVSSRGFGSTSPGKGGDIVGEDFTLKTFDFVADPAMKTAYPEIFTEDVDEVFDTNEFEHSFPDIVEEIRERERLRAEKAVADLLQKQASTTQADMEERVAQHLSDTLREVRESVEGEIRQQLMEDPDVGGARAVLGRIGELVADFVQPVSESEIKAYRDKLSLRETELEELRDENERLIRAARDAGYKLKLETTIASHPKADNIRKMIGDPTKYASLKDLTDRLNDLIEGYEDIMEEEERSLKRRFESDLSRVHDEVEALRSDYEQQLEALRAEVAEAHSETNEFREIASDAEAKARRAVKLAEGFEEKFKTAQSVAQKAERRAKASGYTNSSELMNLIESVDSDEVVDEIIEKRGAQTVSDPALERVRQQVKRGSQRQERQTISEDSIFGDQRLFDDLTPSKLKQLSGL